MAGPLKPPPHPMGNFLSCRAPDGGGRSGGKIVLPDGTVYEFDRPAPVAELMLDHPWHFVVELPPPSVGATKLAPLPADNTIAPDKVYMMLPMAAHGKAAAVSVDEARRIVRAARSAARSRSLPCMVEVAGGKAQKSEKAGATEWSPEGLEEGPEFLSRQYSSKGWRPSLGTIEERWLERKVAHWLF